jgi:outer membrane protein assembly factor BamB
MFTGFGGIENHLLVGARTGTASQFFALDPFTGAQRAGSPYAGPPTIGAISTAASVDYARDQVYFASLEFSAGQPSLWCLQLTLGGFGSTCWSPQLLPASISGGPVERNGIVYVGDNLGQVWAFDAALGTLDWGPFALCGGGDPIKSFVLADRLGTAQDLFYATSTATCAVTDTGTLPLAAKWAISNSAFPAGIPGPSAPIVARLGVSTYVYVGSSDGHLYQINADTGAFTRVLIRTGGTVGAAAFDVRDGMIYVGTDAGAIYAVQAPLP